MRLHRFLTWVPLFAFSLVLACTAESSKPDQGGSLEDPTLDTSEQLDLSPARENLLASKYFNGGIRAISYSPYRDGQGPGWGSPVTQEQVREDLELLAKHWGWIRLYGSGADSKLILEVIDNQQIPLKVMLGAWLDAEVNNPQNPWQKAYTDDELAQQKLGNQTEVASLIELANQFSDTVIAVNVGNEALVDWTDHLVPMQAMHEYVKTVRAHVSQPVSIAENYVPYLGKMDPLMQDLDFITLHTYPIWEQKSIDEALAYTIANVSSVKRRFPNKIIVIGEAGWTTKSDGAAIPVTEANETHQKIYFEQLMQWSLASGTSVFFFEAFDESWKGGPNPDEPEKHWGLFDSNRQPKLAIEHLYP